MFIDKKKHKDGVTVTIKLACYKGMVAATEYSEIFSESVQSAYQKRQQSLVILITRAKIIYIIFLQIFQLKWWALRMIESCRLIESWIQILGQAWNVVPTSIQFLPVNTPVNVDSIMNWRLSFSIFCLNN